MNISEPRFIHVRAQNGNRVDYTLAYRFEQTGSNINVVYGVSQCNKSDTFSREVGRDIATKRMRKAAAVGNTDSIYYGVASMDATPGLHVGRSLAKAFEAERKEHLNKVASEQLAQRFYASLR